MNRLLITPLVLAITPTLKSPRHQRRRFLGATAVSTSRLKTTIGIAVCGFALTACADSPLAPVPNRSVIHYFAAQVDRGEGVLVIDDRVFMDCVGEEVVFHAEVPFRYKSIVTPTGGSVYLEPFVPNSGTGTAIGQTTGTVWTLERVVSPLVAVASDVNGLIHFTATQYWESETGPDMQLFSLLHVSQNARGEITVDKFVYNDCRLQ